MHKPARTTKRHEQYFFDIPIFRTDVDTWAEQWKNKEKKLAIKISNGGIPGEREYEFAEKWLRPEWSAYYYGEMVGMIRLFAINLQIRGELWFIKERPTVNLKRKRWQHLGKLFEFWIHENYSNEEIFEWILEKLKKENSDFILKNRCIDLEAFENTGKYINYLELTGVARS